MKKLILLFCFPSVFTFSQECDHSVETNPDNPVNTSIPANSPFLNQFNWNLGNLVGTQLTNMQYNQLMLHVMNPQQPQYYNFIYNGESPTTENGWELLLLNTGTYPNLNDLPNGTLPDVPYIVLYNRYTGVVRVFANYGDGYLPSNISFDAVKVILTFDNIDQVNGNLRLLNGIDQALDQATEILQVVSVAKHPNSPGKWFVADFQVTYDPCVCFYPSRLRLSFDLIESESLELHGRQISVEQDLITGTAVQKKDYLSNFDYTGNTASGGVAMYRTLEALVNDYQAKLLRFRDSLAAVNEYNAKIERNLAVINLFKQVIINGGNSTIDAIANMAWVDSAVVYANDLIGDTVVKKKEIVKAAKDAFGKEFNQFISTNFKKKPLPTSPVKPVATFSEMHFQGQLTTATYVDGPNFYTPGTYNTPGTPADPLSGEELAYPIYNERLGSFALLKSPKIKMSRSSSDHINILASEWIPDGTYGPWRLYGQRYQKFSRNYQIKLSEDIEYTFNPSLDIKSTEVRAAFVIKAIPKKNTPTTGIVNAYLHASRTTNVVSTNRNIESNAGVKHYGTNFSSGDNFPQYTFDYFIPKTIDFDSVLYETEFFPIDAFYNNTYAIGLMNEYLSTPVITSPPLYISDDCSEYPQQISGGWCFPTAAEVGHVDPPAISSVSGGYLFDFEITMKLMVDIEFETPRSDGTENIVTQIYSYTIDPSSIEMIGGIDLTPNLDYSLLDIGQYPENITLNGTNFGGGAVQNCRISGNTYTCKAWNNIYIDGPLTTSNGFDVNIIAGNEIYEVPGAIVSPEITRFIAPVLDYTHAMPPAADTTVTSFCASANSAPGYQANKPGKKALEMIEAHESAQKTPKQPLLELSLFPVPAQNLLNIQSSIELTGESFVLMDLTGRKLECPIKKMGGTMYELDVSKLADGAYYLSTFSNEGESKRMFNVLRIN